MSISPVSAPFGVCKFLLINIVNLNYLMTSIITHIFYICSFFFIRFKEMICKLFQKLNALFFRFNKNLLLFFSIGSYMGIIFNFGV